MPQHAGVGARRAGWGFWLVRPDDSEVKLPDAGRLSREVGGHLLTALRTAAISVVGGGLRAEEARAREARLEADLHWTREQYEKYVRRFESLRGRRVVRLLTATDKARARLRRR